MALSSVECATRFYDVLNLITSLLVSSVATERLSYTSFKVGMQPIRLCGA